LTWGVGSGKRGLLAANAVADNVDAFAMGVVGGFPLPGDALEGEEVALGQGIGIQLFQDQNLAHDPHRHQTRRRRNGIGDQLVALASFGIDPDGCHAPIDRHIGLNLHVAQHADVQAAAAQGVGGVAETDQNGVAAGGHGDADILSEEIAVILDQ
jgi:hypothetical protein